MNRTVTELAAHLGVSRQLVNNAVKKGHLVRIEGRICDEMPASNKAWIDQRRKSPAHKPVGQSKTREYIPDPGVGPGEDQIELNGRSLLDLSPEELTKLPKATMDKLKSFEAMLKTRQEREIKRRTLIERQLVKLAFGELYTIESAELKTLGAKNAADLAGICDCDDPAKILKLEQRLDREIARILGHIQDMMAAHLSSWEKQ